MAGGRPSKYQESYCDQVIEFFNRDPFELIYITDDEGKKTVATNKHGDPIMKPCALPTKEGFAISIGVHSNTLLNWADDHPEFLCAIKKAEDIQKDILIQNGLIGAYDKTFAIFVAKNVTDMSDKKAIDHTSSDHSMTPKPTTIELIAPGE
jgi:hypothetical protein